MTTIHDIYLFLNTYCPFDLAESWDNPGLNVGWSDRPAEKVLLAMDVTEDVIAAAAAAGCQLIITHHPLFLSPVSRITGDTPEGRRALLLAESGIAHIACHTNLDAAEGGVNTCLAAACGISSPEPFGGFGWLGACSTTLSALVERLKNRLPAALCTGVRCRETVSRIAVVGGSGGGLLEEAAALGCDTFVTGEAKHHHLLLAQELGINLLIFGHYETEAIVLPPLAAALEKAFPGLSFLIAERKPPMEIL